MLEILGARFGNASSSHSGGEDARKALLQARSSVAQLLGGDPHSLLFTSSGTEANNMALLSGMTRDKGSTLVTSSIEHSSIVKTAEHLEQQGDKVTWIKPSRAGLVEVEEVQRAISRDRPNLVSVQWVNSETGVIQPVREIAAVCRHSGVLFHTDAAQAIGKLPVSVDDLDADFVTGTAHKFHGPAGVGFVYAKNPGGLFKLIHGGDQELGFRAGTENLAGIVGTGVAADIRRSRLDDVIRCLTEIRDMFESRLLAEFPRISVNGGEPRACNTSNLMFKGIDGQALMAQLDAIDIHCSQSSACTSRRPEPSYVLRAMGLNEEDAYSSVRFSFGEFNTVAEANEAANRIAPVVRRLGDLLT